MRGAVGRWDAARRELRSALQTNFATMKCFLTIQAARENKWVDLSGPSKVWKADLIFRGIPSTFLPVTYFLLLILIPADPQFLVGARPANDPSAI